MWVTISPQGFLLVLAGSLVFAVPAPSPAFPPTCPAALQKLQAASRCRGCRLPRLHQLSSEALMSDFLSFLSLSLPDLCFLSSSHNYVMSNPCRKFLISYHSQWFYFSYRISHSVFSPGLCLASLPLIDCTCAFHLFSRYHQLSEKDDEIFKCILIFLNRHHDRRGTNIKVWATIRFRDTIYWLLVTELETSIVPRTTQVQLLTERKKHLSCLSYFHFGLCWS